MKVELVPDPEAKKSDQGATSNVRVLTLAVFIVIVRAYLRFCEITDDDVEYMAACFEAAGSLPSTLTGM